jgi:hypothetical protein
MALAVLDLAYQRSTPSIDPNVHPDTPLTEALNNFQAELKNYSYPGLSSSSSSSPPSLYKLLISIGIMYHLAIMRDLGHK